MEGLWQSALVISEVRCERRGSSPRSVCAAEAFAEVPAGLCDPAVQAWKWLQILLRVADELGPH